MGTGGGVGQDPVYSMWAKSSPFHPLWCHLLDVAATAQLLAERFGGIAELPNSFVALVAGLHDLGKADPWFQNKVPELEVSLRKQGVDLPPREAAIVDGQRRYRHEARSAEWVLSWLLGEGWGNSAATTIAIAIHGHHGNFTTEYIYDETESAKALWDGWRRELFDVLAIVLHPPICRIDRFGDASEVGAKLSGYIVLADWIASNSEVYHYEKLSRDDTPEGYFKVALAEARAALKRLDFDYSAMSGASHNAPTFRDVWPELSAMTLRPVQQLLEDLTLQSKLPPGLTIIEAPMGEGKTEAAIYLAECWNQQMQRRGCYLALPTQATANQIHQRYQRFLSIRRSNATPPRLVHGMAWLVDDVAPTKSPQIGDEADRSRQMATDWFRPARRALLADNGVGTVDQVLMAALNVKFGFLRLLGLSSKTLVIDEVHAYDEYMTTIMKRLLEWCRALRVNVVLLSATLSLRQKRELCESYAGKERRNEVTEVLNRWSAETTPYPLVTCIPRTGRANAIEAEADRARSRDITVRTYPGVLEDFDKTALLSLQSVANGGCACVLANTVKAAQAIFNCLLRRQRDDGSLPDMELLLFHARFPAWRRNEIEAQIMRLFGKADEARRPRRAILVATQVVEQSLDVDFDVMFSQIAPIDLLLQRCGRVWRHERGTADRHGMGGPVLHVLLPSDDKLNFGSTEKVYDREILLRTLALVAKRPCFKLPKEFRRLIETCYAEGPLTNALIPQEELQRAAEERDLKKRLEQAKARTHLLPLPSPAEFNPSGNSADEGEGESLSYFVAQTRLGDDSISVLLIDDDSLLTAARTSLDANSKPPRREMLRRLFLCKVSLPRWWFASQSNKSQKKRAGESAAGYEQYFEGEGWLRNQVVLPLRSNQWHGNDSDGRKFLICSDNVLGVFRQTLNSEGEVIDGQETREADAGHLG